MNDLISVIVPIYKVEEYLPRCVDSIIAQTYTNLEIFLVDDGSPDHCGEICDAYALKDARIKVIHKQNGGLSDARNAALDVCKGEYISFVDSDDYVSEDFIESLYHANQVFQTELAVCGIVKFDEYDNQSVDYAPSDTECCVSGDKMMETIWRPSACNKLYHKSIFKDLRYPVGKLYEDLFIYHDILAQIDQISFTGQCSYYYFNRKNSIINKGYDIRNTDLIEGLDLRTNKLREMNYESLADWQLEFMFNSVVDAFKRIHPKSLQERQRLKYVKILFDRHFHEILKAKRFTPAQKAKMALFRFFPNLYKYFFTHGI